MTAASESGKLENEIRKLQHQIEHLQSGKIERYEDYCAGKLTRKRFMAIQAGNQLKMEGLEREAEKEKKQLVRLKDCSRQLDGGSQPAQEVWALSSYQPEVISKLVEAVKVFDDGRLEMELKFRDLLLTGTIG